MDKKITDVQISEIACTNGIEYAALKAFISVESGGIGFAKDTGKIILQFEPHLFRNYIKRKAEFDREWEIVNANKVEGQTKEWLAFNAAFKISPDAAMKSTSIGLGQVLGMHYSRFGYKTVGAMWDDAKLSEANQVKQMVKFVTTDPTLFKALKNKDWDTVAKRYNGSGYKELAKRLGREPYNISLEKAYNKYKTL